MPSFASFSNNSLVIGKGKGHKSYPPVSMKAPSLPETPHLDTSDLLYSVQSIPSPLDQEFGQEYQNHSNQSRPAWHTSNSYTHGEPGFVGGHQYKIERQEERRRLRSLGLLSGSSTPQSELSNTNSAMASASQKVDSRRRSSWQPPLKGKLQKRNKSKEPDQGRKSLETRHTSIDYQSNLPLPPPPPQQHHSFSRLQSYPASSIGSPCATPSPGMTPTRELMHPNPPFGHAGRSNSSLGTMSSTTNSILSPSLGNLVDFYDPNSPLLSPGQAFSTAPSSPIAPLNSQVSSQAPSPIGFHKPRYPGDAPVTQTGISPLIAAQNVSSTSVTSSTAAKKPVLPSTPTPGVNSSNTSVNSTGSQKIPETQPAAAKSGFQPYQPKYAAKSHVTSTVPLTQSMNQEPAATPFVHLDFAPPPKPFARPTAEPRKGATSETRLTTQEAKEYQAIAQATREAYINRTQVPSEITLSGKSNGRPPLAPSKLSFEVRNASSPDPQGAKSGLPPKSILRKPVELPIEDVNTKEEPPRRPTFPYLVQASTNLAPEPLRVVSNPTKIEPPAPLNLPTVVGSQPERGRSTFKRDDQSDISLSRRSSTSARKSIDVETPSAKNFDISKYTQAGSQPASAKSQRAYPPVSYKRPVVDSPSGSDTEQPAPVTHVPPVPPLPDTIQNSRGLSTPPPIRSDNAIESSDEESMERPSTASEAKKGKSKLNPNVPVIDGAPVRPRAPSMSEILKELYKPGYEGTATTNPPQIEVGENPDWLSQLFRTKKQEAKSRPRPAQILVASSASASPPLGKLTKENDSRRSSRHDLSAEELKVHERAERQRLEVERKLMEAESEPNLTPRSSPRLPRPSVSVTASPDLRTLGGDAGSLRSESTTSVDRLDPVVGGSLHLGRVEEIPSAATTSSIEEKKQKDRKNRPTSAEVRQQLGEMTPPHEREDWEIARNSQASLSNLNLSGTQVIPPTPASPTITPPLPLSVPAPVPIVKPVPVIKPVPGRLPVATDPSSPSTLSRPKELFGLDHKNSNSSLISLDVTKTLTKILVVCCNCNRLHDPPSDIYRKMAQGNSSFRCPYCIHSINVLECCSAYTSICNLIEKLN